MTLRQIFRPALTITQYVALGAFTSFVLVPFLKVAGLYGAAVAFSFATFALALLLLAGIKLRRRRAL